MTPAIEIRDLEYAYPDGVRALAGIDLRVEAGEKGGIIGANGAGKSTLLLHLNGILAPERGSGAIFGEPVRKANLRAVRRRVGVVFQNPDDQLFCPTVAEDVAFGPRNMGLPEDEVGRRVADALGVVGMCGFEERSAHHLSFGQRKRVATATVISMRPEIWAFDEPSANLDPATQRVLEAFIQARAETVLVVTQDLLFAAETCARLVILDGGRVVADGPAESILGRDDLLRKHGLEFRHLCRICRRIYPEPA